MIRFDTELTIQVKVMGKKEALKLHSTADNWLNGCFLIFLSGKVMCFCTY